MIARTILAALAVGGLLAACSATVRGELVGHWAFDATDNAGTTVPNLGSGGGGLDGKLVGDAHVETDVSDGTVTRASALALDGNGDWLRINHGVTTLGDGHSFTIAAWIKTAASKMALLGKDDADGKLENDEKIFFVKEGHGGRELGFVACSQEWLSTTTARANDDRWHHVAVVYDALLGRKEVFVDGRNVTSERSWRAGPDSGGVVRIGTSDWGDAGPFKGHIDDVAIYDQALLPDQVRTLRERGPQPFDPLRLLGDVSGEDAWQSLMRLSRVVRKIRLVGAEGPIDDAGTQLGTWYCAGPFKDSREGLHLRSFATVFPPEEQVLAAGGEAIDLDRSWHVKTYTRPGEAVRRWVKHPEWVDGYLNQLPVGPPPMNSETCYLYRTITAERPVSLPMTVIALDNVQAWLNGLSVGKAHNPARSGSSRFAASLSATLGLRTGENRLLLKITSMHGAHGFACAMPPLTPSCAVRPGGAEWKPHRFYPGNGPYVGKRAGSGDLDGQYERFCMQTDGIDRKAAPAVQHESYAAAVLRRLGLPREARALLPKFEDAEGLAAIRKLYLRTCRFNDALEKVGDFRLQITPTPMYDPPRIAMAEALDATVAPTAAGAAYLDRLNALEPAVSSALAANAMNDFGAEKVTASDRSRSRETSGGTTKSPNSHESGYETRLQRSQAAWQEGGPDRETLVLSAAAAIDRMWSEQIRSLPPITFVQCSPFAINAIAPYTAQGASPASICVLDPGHPDRPPRVIYDDPTGAVFDMNLSYDAQTIFFSARRRGVEGGWHVYEIGIDGTGLKQITHGPSDNISPVLLPNGEILFVSTRSGNVVVCQQGTSGVLYVCQRDGTDVRRVSGNTLSDHSPQVISDGRVLFTRWDYGVDRNVFARQTPWTMNPDGTHFQLFFGNTIEDPNGFWEARPIPGRPEAVCVFGPHHQYHAGMIGLIWNRLGFEAPRGEGFRWITTEMPSVGDTTLPWGYQDPYPLSERLFLVSFGGDGGRKNRLYLLDDRGNRKCLYEAPGNLGCWNPLPLAPRERPPVVGPTSDNPTFVRRDPSEANRRPDDSQRGRLVLQDVYQGLSPEVQRGEIKELQIVEQVPRVGTISGMALFGHWTVVGRGTMYVRRLIGTVPVEADGSAHFVAPANRDISFNLLDQEGRAIRHMGSTTQIMPGETIGCVGCHESRDSTPIHLAPPVPLALRREPSRPEYPAWTDNGILDFNRVVQPVLDEYCVECHRGPTPDGAVDLTGDKTHFFSMAYDQLLDRGLVHYIPTAGTGHAEGSAKTRGALVSRIREYLETDHAERVVPPEDRRRIYAWIDANVPYYGTYKVTDRRVAGGRDRWYVGDPQGWFQKQFLPIFNRRCLPCHQRYVTPQTYNYNPGGDGRIPVSSQLWTETALGQFQLGHGRISWTGQIGPDHRINLTHPESSQMLSAPLAKQAGGLGLCQEAENQPQPFADKTDPDYQAMLHALKRGHDKLLANPRVDMLDRAAVISNQ